MAPRDDRRLIVAAAALGAAPFLLTVPFCGLYLDDYSFLAMLEGVSPSELWHAFIRYVPGRNLHIPFFYGLIELTGRSVLGMHLVGLAFDALNAALLFLLVRRLTGLRSVALAAAAVFALAPNHGETHFWITLIPQCQIPTALTLAAFVLATRPGGLAAACAVYAIALFTYDQVFFLWPLLLATAWSRDPTPRRARYTSAAAGLLALNAAHIATRYLSPYASGGRPLIRLSDFFDRCSDAAVAVRKGMLPWPTSSHAHWAWSVPVVIVSLIAAYWTVRAVRARARAESSPFAVWTNGSGWLAAAAAGAAWTVLAYGPNLFWFLSPRHNLLPSIGWSLTVASAGAYAVARSRRAAAALPWLACVFIAAAAVSNVHEGTQWIDSRNMRESLATAVRRLPPPVDTLFLIGAPRYLRRAPAFNLRHDVSLAAGRVLGRAVKDGDNEAAPTRRGVIFMNDLTLLPADAFHWIPAERVNLLSFNSSERSFTCVSALRIDRPDGRSETLPLRANPACALTLPAAADVFLLESVAGPPARARAAGPRSAGLVLLSAAASASGDNTRLELEWRVETPPSVPVAFIPRIKDPTGGILLDAVFPSRGIKRPYPMIWPLVDDLAAGLRLKPGQTLRQTFLLARSLKSRPDGSVLELDIFEIPADGAAASRGMLTVPLALKP